MKKTKLILIIAIIGLAFCAGGYVGSIPTHSPAVMASDDVITKTEYVTEYLTVIQKVEVPVEVPIEVIVEVPVEVVKEIPVGLKFFASPDALKEWIDDNRLPTIWGIPDYDCDDYSIDLVELAEDAGYRLMECPVYRGMVWGSVRVSDTNWARHIGVWTRINDLFYYIEPQTGEITRIPVPLDIKQ